MLRPLRLKRREDRRLREGHVWVFSNEVDIAATPLDGFEPGEPVRLEDASGQVLGTGYVNPRTLIAARLVSRDPEHQLNRSLIVHRLNIALSLRERLFAKPFYRLVFGESDGLPGLVVDRYGDVFVAQLNTAGMERARAEVIAALEKVVKPRVLILRNDSSMRALEQLPVQVETVIGTAPERVLLEENGVQFETDVVGGQKTGWFYDHRMNRARLAPYVAGKRVLDVFSYAGGFGVQAAVQGAAEVVAVDSSADALARVARNAELNGAAARVRGERGDAFEVLKAMRAAREHFDVVIIDPPALIKRRKDIHEGTRAYQRLNQAAMQLVRHDGMLVSCSCSYHLAREELPRLVQAAARHIDRFVQIVEEGHQGPDHPVHPAIAETAYLKAFFVRVLPV